MLAQMYKTNETYHSLSVGSLDNNEIKYERPIGKACLITEGDRTFYELNLWSMPNTKYYLSRNNSNEYLSLIHI